MAKLPTRRPGYFVEPTVVVNTSHQMKVVREEIFGPVLVAMPYEDLDDLVRKANDTEYGLAASIWSQNISRVLELVPRIKAGTSGSTPTACSMQICRLGASSSPGSDGSMAALPSRSTRRSKTVCIAY